jgi:hypothetical protein
MNKTYILSTFLFLAMAFRTFGLSIEVTDSLNRMNPSYLTQTETVRLYADAQNLSNEDVYGSIQFYSNNKPIGDPQPVSILKGQTDSVFIDVILAPGNHTITAGPFDVTQQESLGTTELVSQIFVDLDSDADKIGNSQDPDDDNDGLSDVEEARIGTSPVNSDSDGDGISDSKEVKYGLNPLDSADTAEDLDNDGIKNIDEIKLGTDLNNPDSDGDGISDGNEVKVWTQPP